MRWLLLAWLLLGVFANAFGQAADGVATRQIDFEGELNRLQAVRERHEAQYEAEEAVCYRKFSVTDCLHAVRVRRRMTLDLLRKQEVALRQAERGRKAEDQVARLKEKAADERLAQAAAGRGDAVQAQKEREERASQKARPIARATSNASQDSKKWSYQGRSAADRAQAKKQYQDKLDQARELRAMREKTRLEKSATKAKPLSPPA